MSSNTGLAPASAIDPAVAKNVKVFLLPAEDGIRDYKVTGVQTCALPISSGGNIALQLALDAPQQVHSLALLEPALPGGSNDEIGRASCRGRRPGAGGYGLGQGARDRHGGRGEREGGTEDMGGEIELRDHE